MRLSSSRRERDWGDLRGSDDADDVSRTLGCEFDQNTLAKLLRCAREAFGNSAQLCDAVLAGTFERFDQPIGVQQQMTA